MFKLYQIISLCYNFSIPQQRDEYNREELIREYNAGRYHDKGLPGITNIGMSGEESRARKDLKVSDITSYLRKLRQGVER